MLPTLTTAWGRAGCCGGRNLKKIAGFSDDNVPTRDYLSNKPLRDGKACTRRPASTVHAAMAKPLGQGHFTGSRSSRSTSSPPQQQWLVELPITGNKNWMGPTSFRTSAAKRKMSLTTPFWRQDKRAALEKPKARAGHRVAALQPGQRHQRDERSGDRGGARRTVGRLEQTQQPDGETNWERPK